MNLPDKTQLTAIYGENEKSYKRFLSLSQNFERIYSHKEAEFFTAPGRTEIIGNHTDHNGGLVIAGSIDMDTIGAAFPNNSDVIRITSEGYAAEIVVDLSKSLNPKDLSGTQALVAGMAEGFKKYGFAISGFDAYVSTTVIPAAGVSSSASFEMLFCTIANYFFNDEKITLSDYAKIGKYAENVYWNKSSGVMDQLACAVGGTVLFDFSNAKMPKYEKLPFSFEDYGYTLVIVNTGKSHADLIHEYSDVPKEMQMAASALHTDRLCHSSLSELIDRCTDIPNDRAILRAIHFFEENDRVKKAAEAIDRKDIREVLNLMRQSGTSSWELLQNCYSLQDCSEQKIPLTLTLSDLFLKNINDGVCRIHGGGFAGVIMCILPHSTVGEYIHYISKFVGKNNVYAMNIRETGAIHIHR